MRAIYDSVTAALAEQPKRRFLAVEMLYFSRWWTDPVVTDAQRGKWRSLLARGQVEFATGGWVMHDEIASSFDADINQMTRGHRWIAETFGSQHVPAHAWHIDEQGHVGATAALFRRMDFETLTPNRIPQPLKDALQASRGLGFAWEGLPAQHMMHASAAAQPSSLSTQLLDFYGYCCPNQPRNEYYWDDYNYWGLEGGPPINDTSVVPFVTRMAVSVAERAAWLPPDSDVLLWPWGCDFEFQNASQMFDNMDRVIAFVNARSEQLGFTLQYATLREYFHERGGGAANSTAVPRTDMLPYALDVGTPPLGQAPPPPPPQQNWWTGEFTSWPLMKKMTRAGAAVLRAAEQLSAAAAVLPAAAPAVSADAAALDSLRAASAEAQHHDAVDGTSPARVTATWEVHLANASNNTRGLQERALGKLTAAPSAWRLDAAVELAALLAAGRPAVVAVYNPLAWTVSRFVSLRVPVAPGGGCPALCLAHGAADVRRSSDASSDEAPVVAQIQSWTLKTDRWIDGAPRTSPASASAHAFSAHADTTAPSCELIFLGERVPPLGTRSFMLSQQQGGVCGATAGAAVPAATSETLNTGAAPGTTFTVANTALELTFANASGALLRMRSLSSGGADSEAPLSLRLAQQLVAYPSARKGIGPIASDNYIFEVRHLRLLLHSYCCCHLTPHPTPPPRSRLLRPCRCHATAAHLFVW